MSPAPLPGDHANDVFEQLIQRLLTEEGRAPSTTGIAGGRPSPNGKCTRGRPSPNGAAAAVPSPNGGAAGRPSTNGAAVRDAFGRFVKGNPGGPGNPFARQVAAFRSAVCTTVTADDLRDVACLLVAMAKSGNLAAVRLLFAYTVGRPGGISPEAGDGPERTGEEG